MHRVKFLIIKPNRCTNFSNLFLEWSSTCFGQFLCPSSGVFSLYTQQWCMSCRFADSLPAGSGWNSVPSWSCSQAVSKPVWQIPLLCVQWKYPRWWTEELSETCSASFQEKIWEISASSWFYYKKLPFVFYEYKTLSVPWVQVRDQTEADW